MNKYEGLFILNSNREETIKETIDKISSDIVASGGKVETVQKMDRRPFSRVANKKNAAGFYVNFIFEAQPGAVAPLKARFGLNEEIFRVVFTTAPKTPAPVTTPKAA